MFKDSRTRTREEEEEVEGQERNALRRNGSVLTVLLLVGLAFLVSLSTNSSSSYFKEEQEDDEFDTSLFPTRSLQAKGYTPPTNNGGSSANAGFQCKGSSPCVVQDGGNCFLLGNQGFLFSKVLLNWKFDFTFEFEYTIVDGSITTDFVYIGFQADSGFEPEPIAVAQDDLGSIGVAAGQYATMKIDFVASTSSIQVWVNGDTLVPSFQFAYQNIFQGATKAAVGVGVSQSQTVCLRKDVYVGS